MMSRCVPFLVMMAQSGCHFLVDVQPCLNGAPCPLHESCDVDLGVCVPAEDEAPRPASTDVAPDGEDAPKEESGAGAPRSCQEILNQAPAATSGIYLIRTDAGDAQVECNMRANEGWTLAARIDGARSDTCGSLVHDPALLVCRRGQGVASTVVELMFPATRFRAEARAFAYGTNDGFRHVATEHAPSVEEMYVDGISITSGFPGDRRHLATFAAGLGDDFENEPNHVYGTCPCQGGSAPPPWVDAWVCESPSNSVDPGTTDWISFIDTNDPLFDAQGISMLCRDDRESRFEIEAPIDTSAGFIEVRLMGDEAPENEDVLLKRLEIWVK